MRDKALKYLRQSLGNERADFRSGQWEAINALVNRRQKLLIVQKTGWGKSAVYFITTRLLRNQGHGLTIIISPLLALMRNQTESAERLGVRAETINSSNRDDWESVKRKVLNNEVDCLLISPERLANDDFVDSILLPISSKIGLMVIDEAHCISDWGHDFRPDYRRIINIIRQIPPNTPIVGTTATANDRVIADIKEQIDGIEIQRGSLLRESLVLQTIRMPDQAHRLAWLVENIPMLPNTGIIYTLTTRDADQVAIFLKNYGIKAKAYYSSVEANGFENSDQYREHLENLLYRNKIKVLVATSALGMGYDKPDLGFVIHYQMPNSIIAYYQQVGRAGRAIDSALGILISGGEDQDIHEYFRRTAFPQHHEINHILRLLEENDGLTISQIEQVSNLRKSQIDHVLKTLSVETFSPIIKVGAKWRRTTNHYQYNQEKIDEISNIRAVEWNEINQYLATNSCLMRFLGNALNDNSVKNCGKCCNCLQHNIISPNITNADLLIQAQRFLKKLEQEIEPRKQIPKNALDQYGFCFYNISNGLQAEIGRVLSRWGDAGWGAIVKEDKQVHSYFCDELVDATAEMIQERWNIENHPTWICCIPSLNEKHINLVPDFSQRLANKLGIPFINVIEKIKTNKPQKSQNNSFHQCKNLDGVFSIQVPISEGNVLLIDDIIDSRWTMTIATMLLRQAGSGLVYPIALASTSVSE